MTDYDWRGKENKERKSGIQTHDLKSGWTVLYPLCHNSCPFHSYLDETQKNVQVVIEALTFSRRIFAQRMVGRLSNNSSRRRHLQMHRGNDLRRPELQDDLSGECGHKKFHLAERCRLADTLVTGSAAKPCEAHQLQLDHD